MARRMQTSWPTQKVQAGAVAGALTTIALFILKSAGIDVPGEVGAAIVTVLTFLVSYVVPPHDRDVTVPLPSTTTAN